MYAYLLVGPLGGLILGSPRIIEISSASQTRRLCRKQPGQRQLQHKTDGIMPWQLEVESICDRELLAMKLERLVAKTLD